MSFWDNFTKKNLSAAHRGARSLRAENTMGSFIEAIGKCDFIEFDVGFSKDGIAVIIHDDTLSRTSNVANFNEFKKPYNVVDYTYEQLCKLDFGSWFKKEDAQKIPTLQEVLKFLKKHNFPVNIEIKDMSGTSFDKVAVKNILQIVKEEGMENLVLLSSFNHKYIKEAYTLAPNIQRAALQVGFHPKDLIKYLNTLHVKSYNIEEKIANEKLVKELSDAGFYVNVFTVNQKKDKIQLYDFGVKSIFTDILE